MNKQSVEKFYVVGIATRTINENGKSAQDIEVLWQTFWNENISDRIANKLSQEIYAVYTNYESDHTQEYDTIVGYAVSSIENIPDGLTGITIEETTYQKITSSGKMPEAIFNTWLKIWADEELNKRRTYRADFTVHGKKYFDGDQAEVETFISVKA